VESGGPAPSPESAERAAPQKAEPIRVEPDARLGELIDAALEGCLSHLLANRQAARSIEDPEGVHQLRVAVRRSRSALGLFRASLAREPTRVLRRELRWLGRALSPARDQDVFCVETLPGVRAALPEAPGLARLCWEAELRRLAAHDIAREALDAERLEYLVLRFDRYVRGGEWRLDLAPKKTRRLARPARRAAARLLDERFGEVRLLERPFSQLSADELHALRIRVKRLRYATDFLAPLYSGRAVRRFAKRLRVLQDSLGRINDGRVADALVDDLLAHVEPATRARIERAAGVVSGWSHAHAVRERATVEKTWRRVAGATPWWR